MRRGRRRCTSSRITSAGAAWAPTGQRRCGRPCAAREGRGPLEPALRFGLIAVDGEELDGLAADQVEQHERLEGSGDLTTFPVGNQHALAGGGIPWDNHHRARALSEDLPDRLVGLSLGLELEVRLPTQHDHVAAEGFLEDLLVRPANVLHGCRPYLGLGTPAVERGQEADDVLVRIAQARSVARHFIG